MTRAPVNAHSAPVKLFNPPMTRSLPWLKPASRWILCGAAGIWLVHGLQLLIGWLPWTAPVILALAFFAWGNSKWRVLVIK